MNFTFEDLKNYKDNYEQTHYKTFKIYCIDYIIKYWEENGEESVKAHLQDILDYGSSNGIVPGFVYDVDCARIYKEYAESISSDFYDYSYGDDIHTAISAIFGDRWNIYDPLCADDENQGLVLRYVFDTHIEYIVSQLEEN